MSQNLVLLSSGLDSAVNLLMGLEDRGVGAAVTVDYGQRAASREVEKARAICDLHGVRHIVLEARWLGGLSGDALTTPESPLPELTSPEMEGGGASLESSMRAVWVPNRNGLLASMGACVAEALGLPRVVMGLNAEEAASFPDNSPGFIREFNRAFSYSTLSGIRLKSYTIKWNKIEILRAAVLRELDFRLIWSCYNGEELMCGRCESCARLLRAAGHLGILHSLEGLFCERGE